MQRFVNNVQKDINRLIVVLIGLAVFYGTNNQCKLNTGTT